MYREPNANDDMYKFLLTQALMKRNQQQNGGGGLPNINPMQFLNGGTASPAAALGGNGGTSGFMGSSISGGGYEGGAAFGELTGSTPALGGSSGGAGGSSGLMGSLGPAAAIAAAVAATKGLEYRNPDNAIGKLGQTFNAPSFNQIKADPKIGLTTAAGIPFINSFIMNDKAKRAKPEWESLFGGLF